MTTTHKVARQAFQLAPAKLALVLVAALCAGADCACAAQTTPGGGRRGGDDRVNRPAEMLWYPTVKAAIEAAQKDSFPVMFVCDDRGGDDKNRLTPTVERLSGWPPVIQMSQGGPGGLAAVKAHPGTGDTPATRVGVPRAGGPGAAARVEDADAKALFARVKVPFRILWLDHYGNVVMAQRRPDQSDAVTGVVANWKSTLATLERFFKDTNRHGEAFLDRGKLREAYQELALIASCKGAEAERAQACQQKVRDRWAQLLKIAADSPADSVNRAAIIKGLRRDVLGLDYAATLEEAIEKLGVPKQVAAAEKPAAPATPEAKTTAAAPPAAPAVEDKPLSEVVAARPTVKEEPREDAGVDASFLKGSKDDRLKDANKLVQDGLDDFRKATADTADRGEARNGLLRGAHGKFDKAMTILDQTSGGKPDAATEKLMERISMLMYGCLKYQSLPK
ncbi:MAG: hypothetical protein NTW87_26535 [Planctomycetota bacterium]|nr:hypothetical protein [Planctomycetota bacterium]